MKNKIKPSIDTGARRAYAADEWIDFALNLARGSYQRDIVNGRSRVSGSDLKGRAAKFSGKYTGSRRALYARMARAGIPTETRTMAQEHGRRRLVIAGQVQ